MHLRRVKVRPANLYTCSWALPDLRVLPKVGLRPTSTHVHFITMFKITTNELLEVSVYACVCVRVRL